ncbi:MAG TPA: MraY family glycosyltransferase [Syntrophobacteraceae bacterium]|nr:MraY family glycosyltransferase [Syntrophobacteraceae bacterium]
MIFISTLLISVFTTIALIPVLSSLAVHLHILDIPDERKIHSRPIPKSGGLAMALGVLIPIVVWLPFDASLKAILSGAAIVVIFGFIDDSRGLSYLWKFAAQTAAAVVVTCYGGVWIADLGALLPQGVHLPGWVGIPLTVVVIVGATNAINLSDGLDGLAGGISIMSFICIAYLAYVADDLMVVLLSLAMIGAIFGFLRFNTYPATLFMGDAGSQFLGFWAVSLSLKITQANHGFNKLLPLMLLGIPILDTFSVMLGRIASGKSPFMPDKNHLHHRFMELGLSHSETVLVVYALQASMIIPAYLMRFGTEWLALALSVCFGAAVLFGLAEAKKTGWLYQRHSSLEKLTRSIKNRYLIIKISFKVLETGIILLLAVTAFLPVGVPVYVCALSTGLAALVIATWFTKKKWMGGAVRLGFYFFIPFAVYLSEMDAASRLGKTLADVYNLSFAVLVLFIILTLRFTRRKKGFKTTPMDFIVLFVALIVPNLPGGPIRNPHMSLIAAKVIVFFFGCEVLMGELRGNYTNVVFAFVCILSIVSLRGFLF